MRLEALLRLPMRGELFARLPQIDREPSEIGGAERGGFQHLGPHHRYAEEIRLELHQEVVRRGAAIYAQLGQALASILLHRLEELRALEGDRLERSSGDVRARGAA